MEARDVAVTRTGVLSGYDAPYEGRASKRPSGYP